MFIVNSGGFDARNDGAKPIDNRRAIEDDVTKFSSIDYITNAQRFVWCLEESLGVK
ncbi:MULTISPECIES: palindromic element RPE2 domain-containing protein [unclassified Candidatus Tisiphia]|uniref:palindromic element RPE2 domain-containing protein n=1 Tax=unclassified Candidatus Tisiphia TaxID=2996318 RepID=UPI001E74CA78|nr:MAG: palindromic element RPE2 domain-containing protein [Rickettsia endosymbiont of Cimex lectularius]